MNAGYKNTLCAFAFLCLLPSNSVVPVYFGLFPFEDANTPFKIERHHQHLEKHAGMLQ